MHSSRNNPTAISSAPVPRPEMASVLHAWIPSGQTAQRPHPQLAACLPALQAPSPVLHPALAQGSKESGAHRFPCLSSHTLLHLAGASGFLASADSHPEAEGSSFSAAAHRGGPRPLGYSVWSLEKMGWTQTGEHSASN